jgi:hypothetical protein
MASFLLLTQETCWYVGLSSVIISDTKHCPCFSLFCSGSRQRFCSSIANAFVSFLQSKGLMINDHYV